MRTPTTRPPDTSSDLRGRFGQDHRAALFGSLGEPAAECDIDTMTLPWLRIGRGRWDRHRPAAGEDVDGLAGHGPVARHVVERRPVAEEPLERTRVDHGARKEV